MQQCIDIWKASGAFVVGMALFLSYALGLAFWGCILMKHGAHSHTRSLRKLGQQQEH